MRSIFGFVKNKTYLRTKFKEKMAIENEIFSRTLLLVGEAAMERIQACRVIIFGVGGVGSWVAESLIRSGIGHLTMVDSDRVDVTNVNRQCPATTETIGCVKVEAMKSRLLAINPKAEVEAIEGVYDRSTRDSFHLETYDYVIDAIDSLECKAELIRHATSLPHHVKFFSSMGAALKMDPTQIRVDEFWQVKGCPLARALRQKFKRSKLFPARKFRVVYSPEVLTNKGEGMLKNGEVIENKGEMLASRDEAFASKPEQSSQTDSPETNVSRNHSAPVDWHEQKVHVNGTIAHTTAIFGFTLAGLVMQDLCRE